MKCNTESGGGILKSAILILGVAIGALLLILGSFSDKKDSDASAVAVSSAKYSEAEYERMLIEKIENICAEVSGVGKVSVALTLDGSYRAVYAQNSANGSGTKHEYLLVGSGSDEAALLLGYTPPEILGVGIVCEGGESAGVRAEIISLVCATLDIPTNKIYVAAAKK